MPSSTDDGLPFTDDDSAKAANQGWDLLDYDSTGLVHN